MPRARAIVFALIVALIFPGAGGASRPTEPRATPARNESAVATAAATATDTALPGFSKRRALRHVRRLARTIGPRVRARRNERRAAAYIRERFEAFGYKTYVQKFSVDGRTSRNVVARRSNTLRYPVIVGAHMDTVPRSPGANDNASGVAVMLEVARIFADRPQARFVKFVAFGAEEYGTDGTHHRGSLAFVRRLGDEGRRKLAGMLSVDMVADGRPLLIATAGIGPRAMARIVYRKIANAGIAARRITMCDCSDNGPFERAGIPAALAWSGSEPDYHSPSDRVGSLPKRDLVRSGRALRAFVKTLGAGLIRRLRRY